MINRNKKIIMILSTVFTVVLAISFTYAFFYYGKEGSTITLEAGSIVINFEEETNYFTIHDTYPKSDTMGMIDVNYYDFTVSGSKGAEDDILYEIQVEQLEGNTIQEEYVSVYLTDQDDNELGKRPKKLTDLSISKYNGNRVVYDNYICTENQVEDYRLRIWVNEDYTENVQNTFNFKVVLYAVNDDANTLYETVEETLSSYLLEKDGEEDYDARIVSGSKDDENLKNYVWYSGKLWRIVALNNNGTIKMVTDNNITTIAWGANTTYEGSWIYQWLNEDFKDTLYNYKNLLVEDYEWNATETTTTDKPAKTTMVSAPVGLLNAYEYVQSYSKTSGSRLGYLLNRYYCWWLMTPYSSSDVRYVYNYDGLIDIDSLFHANGVRPSINLKSNIVIYSGSGSKNEPYTIKGDIGETDANELLNKRISGEYVNFDNELYRIVNIENNITKIVKVSYFRDNDNLIRHRKYAKTVYGTGTNASYWDYYLNNDWFNSINNGYRNMIAKSDWYLGKIDGENGDNYKNSICAVQDTQEPTSRCKRTNDIYNGYIGLGRIGEMFTCQASDDRGQSDFITITPGATSYSSVLYIRSKDFIGVGDPDLPQAARPSFNLSSDVVITEGLGTKSSPFEIAKR